MKSIVFALSLLAAGTATTTAIAAEPVLAGYDRFAVSAVHRPSLMQGSLWYPVGTKTYVGFIGKGPVFKATKAMVGAGVKEGSYPLILLSHGSGGNMDAISWLSSELANRGMIVAGVNHPGSTSGDSSPRRSVKLQQRANDISAVLDHLLADPYFAQFIDPDRIFTAGFSLGGATALNLGGISFDQAAYANYCKKFGDEAQDCIFLAKGGVEFDHLPDEFSADNADSRVSGIIAIDPGFTYAISDQSVQKTNLPVHLISLGKENIWKAADVGPKGSNLVARLQNVTHATFAPAHHFTFLAECTEKGALILKEEADDPICDDPDGTDRAGIHAEIVGSIASFVDTMK
ncbi:MAG: hypothetical protein ABJY83_02085 [Roseibium sp.]